MPRSALAGRYAWAIRGIQNLCEEVIMLATVLVVVVLLLLIGALPAWPYSRSWGYYPTGGLGLVLVVLIVLLLLGRL